MRVPTIEHRDSDMDFTAVHLTLHEDPEYLGTMEFSCHGATVILGVGDILVFDSTQKHHVMECDFDSPDEFKQRIHFTWYLKKTWATSVKTVVE